MDYDVEHHSTYVVLYPVINVSMQS